MEQLVQLGPNPLGISMADHIAIQYDGWGNTASPEAAYSQERELAIGTGTSCTHTTILLQRSQNSSSTFHIAGRTKTDSARMFARGSK